MPWLIIIPVFLSVAFSFFFVVKQQSIVVVEFLGRFSRIAPAGLNFKIPFLESISKPVNLRIQQLDVEIETKTKDNVFVKIITSVQFYVVPERVYEAYYKLSNAKEQIRAFVFDVVRAEVPKIALDDVFEKKDEIAIAVKKELSGVMDNFGYGIFKALVTDIDPAVEVKASMNKINAAERLKEAAKQEAETEKIRIIRKAEAEAKSRELQGVGIANQRKAILEGLKVSVDEFQQEVPGVGSKEVVNLVMLVQYLDMLEKLGSSSKTNSILIPHSPGILSDLSQQITNALMISNQATKK